METVQLIQPTEQFTEFMALPDGLAKNIRYYNNISGNSFTEASIAKKDGCIYYASNVFKIVKSTKSSYYIKRVTKDGFTIDQKGKLSVWFNKSIFQIPFINEVFKYFNFNWLSVKLHPFITKGIFEKMVANKITNNTDVCKAYIKAMRINCSPALFLNLFETTSISKQDFLRQSSVAKDTNHLIEYLLEDISTGTHDSSKYEKRQIFNDMVKEAQILEKKIDFKWSLNRLKEEHKAWTEQIMKVEIDSLEDVKISKIEKFDRYTPQQFKLLQTQKEVFIEGSTMKHCIYTAYWSSIKTGNYLVYHINSGDEEATLGVNLYNDNIIFNQCYSRYNHKVSDVLDAKVRTFVEELNEQLNRDGILKQHFEEKTALNNIINDLPF